MYARCHDHLVLSEFSVSLFQNNSIVLVIAFYIAIRPHFINRYRDRVDIKLTLGSLISSLELQRWGETRYCILFLSVQTRYQIVFILQLTVKSKTSAFSWS